MAAVTFGGSVSTSPPATIQVSGADGDVDAVRAALSLDAAACNARDDNGHSPLAAAVSYDNVEAARILLAAGAIPTLADTDGDTPLHVCASVNCASLLLREGGHNILHIQNAEDKTPLQCHREELEEALMRLDAERMIVMNANAATEEAAARMREPLPETVAEVERLQRLVAYLEVGGDAAAVQDDNPKDGGVEKDEECGSSEVEADADASKEDSVTKPPPSP